jgi:hypothetical protein
MAAEVGKDYPDPHLTPNGRALVWLTLHVAALLRSAAMTDPPLAYRGCISFGAFAVDRQFILGPAVDQAAELHNLAEGAFVWLDETGRDILKREPVATEPGFPHTEHLHSFTVPLKNGASFETFAVVPYGVGYRAKANVNARLLSSFEGAVVDVSKKKENTRDFLVSAHEASNAAFYQLDRHGQFMHGVTDNGPGS